MKAFPLSNRINERTGWKSFDFKDSSGQKGRLSFYSDKTADKDARLMAAAPMLLEALQRIADCQTADVVKYIQTVDQIALDALIQLED